MGQIVVTEFVSLDGVFEDPGGAEGYQHGGWTFTFDRGADGDKFKLDELTAADAQLLGRVTYQGFATASARHADAHTLTLTPASRTRSPMVAVACTTALAFGA